MMHDIRDTPGTIVREAIREGATLGEAQAELRRQFPFFDDAEVDDATRQAYRMLWAECEALRQLAAMPETERAAIFDQVARRHHELAGRAH